MFRLGEEEAIKLGYTFHIYSNSGDFASYTKDGISLEVTRSESREISARFTYIHDMLVLSTMDLSFPNKNFHLFESKMLEAKSKLEQE